jgi:cyclopropane fatty-acyl-phospholipid synthase-like methyltransferase
LKASKKEWFEEESFWLNYGPIMFDEQHWAEAHGIAEQCCKIAHLSKGAKILDAGCGPGRISVELALRGMSVTGVDIIQPFLDTAKETADDEKVKLTLLNADLRSFTSRTKFDAAVNLYTSFGYCDSIAEDTKIIRHIAGALKKGGTFILECTSREIAVHYFTEGEWFERANMTVLTHFEVVGAWEGLRSHWTLIAKDGKRIDHEFVQRLYSAVELKNIILKNGFSSAEIYGGYGLTPYDYSAKTMVIVAKK